MSLNYTLGCLHYFGKNGYPVDVQKGLVLFRAGAEMQDPRSQYMLGRHYYSQGNLEEAIRMWKLGAEQLEPNALYMLSSFQTDQKEALRLLRLSAERGHSVAQNVLGNAYYHGRYGLEVDSSEAIRLLRMSAERGNPRSQADLAFFHNQGWGVEKDPVEAVRLYKLSAEQDDMFALSNLGYHYLNGLGVEKDTREALKYYELSLVQAKVKGDDEMMGDSEYMISGIHRANGDLDNAKKYYELAQNHAIPDVAEEAREALNTLH
jgi:TPR repeat protein